MTKTGHHSPRPKASLRRADMTEPLWTVEDAAAYLRLAEETIRTMARTGKIPAIKVGKGWRFRAVEIKSMLKSTFASGE